MEFVKWFYPFCYRVLNAMIQEIKKLDTSALVDLLAAYTANHSRMLKEGATDDEFAKCSLSLRSIQAEIDSRKQTAANASSTEANNNFQPEYTQ
jgi:hypothetical protein